MKLDMMERLLARKEKELAQIGKALAKLQGAVTSAPGRTITEKAENRIRELERALALEKEKTLVAFVQGAKWWEYECEGATMWQADQNRALAKAQKKEANGTLGFARL